MRWIESSLGLLLPSRPPIQSRSVKSRRTPDIQNMAAQVRVIFEKYAIRNFSIADVGRLVADVERKIERLSETNVVLWQASDFIDCLSLWRISDAVGQLDGHPAAASYLGKLTEGPLRMRIRKPSLAKDTLWELEVWSRLLRAGVHAYLDEQPDVIWSSGTKRFGIACKKVYSTKHVQDIMSKAVSQIRRSGLPGIVAFNLDDLMPNGAFNPPNGVSNLAAVRHVAHGFILRHRGRFNAYSNGGRIFGVLVGATSISLTGTGTQRFPMSLDNPWTMWLPNSLAEDERTAIDLLNSKVQELP